MSVPFSNRHHNSLSNRLSLGLRRRRLNTKRVVVATQDFQERDYDGRKTDECWCRGRALRPEHAPLITCGRDAATRPNFLISEPSKVLARDKLLDDFSSELLTIAGSTAGCKDVSIWGTS